MRSRKVMKNYRRRSVRTLNWLSRAKALFTREKVLRQVRDWKRILLNPRLLLCLFLAWMITNGWSYILFGLGTFLGIGWMQWLGGAYMSLLWLPFTPEKLVTLVIALFLLKRLFPQDERTLGELRAKLSRFRRKRRRTAGRVGTEF